MHKRLQASLALAVIALALMALVLARVEQRAVATTTNTTASAQLASLPASDIIIFVDTQRFVSDTLPNFLANDPALFAKVNAKLDRFQKETGIDPRSFDSLAIGMRFGATPNGDPRFVAIAHGSFNAASLIDTAFETARKKENIGREEQTYEGKKIFVLTHARDQDDDTAPSNQRDASRMAVTELDSSTIALGDLESIRATVNPGMARAEQTLVDLATRTPNAFAGFAGNLPPGATQQFGIRNSRADKLAASVRQIYGSVSTAGTAAETFLGLRTENQDQARDIAQAINGLKLISKLGFGKSGANKAEAEAFSNLIENLSVTSQNDEVEIKLNTTQSDIAPLMRRF
jgi:hypothetical protein